MLVLVGQVMAKKDVSLEVYLIMAKDSAAQIEIGRLFLQLWTVQEKGQ